MNKEYFYILTLGVPHGPNTFGSEFYYKTQDGVTRAKVGTDKKEIFENIKDEMISNNSFFQDEDPFVVYFFLIEN